MSCKLRIEGQKDIYPLQMAIGNQAIYAGQLRTLPDQALRTGKMEGQPHSFRTEAFVAAPGVHQVGLRIPPEGREGVFGFLLYDVKFVPES